MSYSLQRILMVIFQPHTMTPHKLAFKNLSKNIIKVFFKIGDRFDHNPSTIGP